MLETILATRVDMKRMRSYSYNASRARICGWVYAGNYQSDYADWVLSHNRTGKYGCQQQGMRLGSGNPDTPIGDISIPAWS